MKIFAALKLPLLVAATLGLIIYSERLARPETRSDRVEVTYWEKWTGFEADAMRAVVNDFNKSQDKIYVKYLSVTGVDSKTLFATSAGIPPDLAGLYDWNVSQFADNGALMSLDEMSAEASIKKEDYIRAYWDICFYRGKLRALPTTPGSTALHYNIDAFAEAGIKEPPKTIEDLMAACKKLKKEKDGRIVQMGFLPYEPGWWNWGYGFVFGGTLWDGESKCTANCPENIRAFEWVQEFSREYGVTRLTTMRQGFGGFASPENPFMAGKVATVLQGVWMANFIKEFNKDLKWGAVPFPYSSDHPERAGHTFVGLDVIAIPAGAKHPKEAFEFLKYVHSQPAMEKLCLLQKKHSPLAQASAEFYSKHPNPYIKLFTEVAKSKYTYMTPQTGFWPEYSSELGAAFDEVNLLKATPKAALDRVQKRIEPKLAKYMAMLKRREEAGQ